MKNFGLHERIKRMAQTITGMVLLISVFGASLQIYIYRNDLKTGMKLFSEKLLYGGILIAVIWALYFFYLLIFRPSDNKDDD